MFDACISPECCEKLYCMHSDIHARSDKGHACCECKETIEAGVEHYLYVPACEDDVDEEDESKMHPDDVSGHMLEEEHVEYRMCRACQAIWDTLGDGTYVFGDLDEHLDESSGICIHYDGSDYTAEEEWDDLSSRNSSYKVVMAAVGITGEAKVVAGMRLLRGFLSDEQLYDVVGMVMGRKQICSTCEHWSGDSEYHHPDGSVTKGQCYWHNMQDPDASCSDWKVIDG